MVTLMSLKRIVYGATNFFNKVIRPDLQMVNSYWSNKFGWIDVYYQPKYNRYWLHSRNGWYLTNYKAKYRKHESGLKY